nr:hypothetical protein CFP56_71612 [Quercus suber]
MTRSVKVSLARKDMSSSQRRRFVGRASVHTRQAGDVDKSEMAESRSEQGKKEVVRHAESRALGGFFVVSPLVLPTVYLQCIPYQTERHFSTKLRVMLKMVRTDVMSAVSFEQNGQCSQEHCNPDIRGKYLDLPPSLASQVIMKQICKGKEEQTKRLRSI